LPREAQEAISMEPIDWDDRLDDFDVTVELSAQLDDWVTLDVAARQTGASRAALRTWYRGGEIPSRLTEGPHGPTRLVPLAVVAARAEASPRLRYSAQRRLDAEAHVALLRHRVDLLEARLSALESRRAAAQ
jgi:transposase